MHADTCYNMDEGPDYDSKENHVKCLEKRKLQKLKAAQQFPGHEAEGGWRFIAHVTEGAFRVVEMQGDCIEEASAQLRKSTKASFTEITA